VSLSDEILHFLHGPVAEDLIDQRVVARHHRVVSTLPRAPGVGDEVIYKAAEADGVYWHLVYLPDDSPWPWKYIGGPPLRAFVNTSEGLGATTGTWLDPTTVGPSISVPFSGFWDFDFGVTVASPAALSTLYVGIAAGAGTPPLNYPSSAHSANSVNFQITRKTTYYIGTALEELRLRYNQNVATYTVAERYLYATPVRVVAP
jgi:hypothetical protein